MPQSPDAALFEVRRRGLEQQSSSLGLAHLGGAVLHAAVVALLWICWREEAWPVVVPLWLVLAWLNHASLVRLHEAVHNMLFRSRRWNEISGVAIGTLALTPMSVYRYVHAQHHAHLGGPADPEFWPYNLPGTPRSLRRAYAWMELLVGWLFTPSLYSLRTARAWGRLRPRMRRRLVLEWLLLVCFWGVVLAVAWSMKLWGALLVVHVVPAWMTGSAQTVRKFTEHLGMAGDSIYSMTRTVRYHGRLGRLLSATQLFVDLHATHHRFPAIPYARLPEATDFVYQNLTDEPLYPNHLAALRDALRHLGDPTVGPQWLTTRGGSPCAGDPSAPGRTIHDPNRAAPRRRSW